jgi:hypothetical protein
MLHIYTFDCLEMILTTLELALGAHIGVSSPASTSSSPAEPLLAVEACASIESRLGALRRLGGHVSRLDREKARV